MTCVICMDLASSHIVLPCAHMCLCADCADLIRGKTCPICRCGATDVKMVYIVSDDAEENVDNDVVSNDVDENEESENCNAVDEYCEASLCVPNDLFDAAVKVYCAYESLQCDANKSDADANQDSEEEQPTRVVPAMQAIDWWLHANRSESDFRFDDNAMHTAAASGHLAVVQWLHEKQSEMNDNNTIGYF